MGCAQEGCSPLPLQRLLTCTCCDFPATLPFILLATGTSSQPYSTGLQPEQLHPNRATSPDQKRPYSTEVATLQLDSLQHPMQMRQRLGWSWFASFSLPSSTTVGELQAARPANQFSGSPLCSS